jgi:hypothetical protein
MLETASLLIHPWQLESTGWARRVANGTNGAVLGQARWLGLPKRAWYDWLRGQRIDVLETEDAALLMTVVRSWGFARTWDLYDAEERRVGAIAAPVLIDSEGGRRAYLDGHPDRGTFLSPLSRLLAEYEVRSGDGTRLRFAADLEPNPFLRMLLLAGVLTQEVPPR